ncbi:protein VACUOLELESS GAMETOPHYTES-like isoform X2 [Actinidia eriantha]|uniref:protein VACUOLELESS GAMETOPHYTES-like isoform X2 n=1 Tax=Actinidia eriantha TaxID=165200 RepID=UPI002588FC51|nr:protein VACUOLELESS GAMETOPHYTES-like isoform X2 [Actinidia eriantha]
MGELTTQPEPTIHHFSHPHLLHLTTTHRHRHRHETIAPPPCSACKIQNSDPTYTCQTCPYTLHLACSQLPQNINHPSHHHPLSLTFSPPYHNKKFLCNICRSTGSNHWLYRCGLCDFDAHLRCANAQPPVGPVQASSQAQVGPVQPVQMQEYQTPLRFQNQRIRTPVGAPYAAAEQQLSHGLMGGHGHGHSYGGHNYSGHGHGHSQGYGGYGGHGYSGHRHGHNHGDGDGYDDYGGDGYDYGYDDYGGDSYDYGGDGYDDGDLY